MNQPESFRVRQMTLEGIIEAKQLLGELRANSRQAIDRGRLNALLQDNRFGVELAPAAFVEPRGFANRRAAGEYLNGQLQPLGVQQIAGNHALWSWLGMFYLEQAIPRTASGNLRWSDSDAPYVLNPGGEGRGEKQGHRHRLMAAYEIYRRRRESGWCVMLDQPVSSMEHFAERLLGAPLLFNSFGVVDLAQELYADWQKRSYKQGFQGSGSEQRPPGGLVRLIDVLNQLSMTYDVYGMAAGQLLPLLPPEFEAWMPAASALPSAASATP